MTEGGCLCGAQRYAVAAPFEMMLHCHCSMCRKHHGAAFATFVSAPYTAFRWIRGEAETARYPSSEGGTRSYCKHCGSVGPQLAPDAGFALCPAGNLEGNLNLSPQSHIFVGSKAPWYTIGDDLPRYDGYPPELGGGTGVERPQMPFAPGVIGGSCLCGEVAYELEQPSWMINCHCSRCRKGRSAAHATNLFVSLDRFRWLRGEELVKEYKVPEARTFTVAFCTRCGAGAPRVARERNRAVVPAAALDRDPGIRPEMHIYVDSKASWFDVADALPQHAEAPPG